jgi:hypothetical protein
MMTNKHFEIVAEAVSNLTKTSDRWLIAAKLADSFEAENPLFDRVRFIDACRPKDWRVRGSNYYTE